MPDGCRTTGSTAATSARTTTCGTATAEPAAEGGLTVTVSRPKATPAACYGR
ncbi:hypothetical protein [Streptomyces sp. NPDC001828]|uniref:hypothetical protein n=1 Tax=Streptomyces sp. NPDC001828 TaxID=3364615 RepID=UPI003673B756